MNKKSGTSKAAATKLVKSIRRKTRQTYSAEEKIRIVLAGLQQKLGQRKLNNHFVWAKIAQLFQPGFGPRPVILPLAYFNQP